MIIPETKIPEITEEVIMPIPQTIDFYIEPRPISSFLTQGTSPSITSTIKSYKELAKEKINNGLNIVQKITQNIDNITENLNSKETPKEISGKEVEEKLHTPYLITLLEAVIIPDKILYPIHGAKDLKLVVIAISLPI